MKSSSLHDRIRSARIAVRSRQPLDYRIQLVRKKRAATNKSNPRILQVRLDEIS